MSDDWRVELDVEEHGGLQHLRDRARERAVGREARQRLGEGVVITVDDDRLYAYADTEARAREAEVRLRELAAEHGLQVKATVARWHPEEQRWESADAPLPSTPAEHAAEQSARDAEQAAEGAQHGYAEWEVRVELADRDAAAALAKRLETTGLAVVCRSHVVVIAAATEHEANALAERLRGEVPEATNVTAEGSAAAAMAEQNPLSAITGRWRRT
jgi:hypothetical protein